MTEEERKKPEVISVRLNEIEAEDLNNFMRDHNYNSKSEFLKELIKKALTGGIQNGLSNEDIEKIKAEAEDLRKKKRDFNSEIQKMKEEAWKLRREKIALLERIDNLKIEVNKLKIKNEKLRDIIIILISLLVSVFIAGFGSMIFSFITSLISSL